MHNKEEYPPQVDIDKKETLNSGEAEEYYQWATNEQKKLQFVPIFFNLCRNAAALKKIGPALPLFLYLASYVNRKTGINKDGDEEAVFDDLQALWNNGYLATTCEERRAAKVFDVSEWTIGSWVSRLKDAGFIKVYRNYKNRKSLYILGYKRQKIQLWLYELTIIRDRLPKKEIEDDF